MLFACAACGKKLQVKAELAGKNVKCPGCGKVTLVPVEKIETRDDDMKETRAFESQGSRVAATQRTTAEVKASEEEISWNFLAPAERPDEIGRLGPYRVLKVLGHGGMGVVFRAEDPHLERLVALKAMRPSIAASPTAKKRFLREAKAAAALKHDHIVSIYQVGEDRGAPFLAMEFLEGEPLDVRLKREKRLPLRDILRICEPAS